MENSLHPFPHKMFKTILLFSPRSWPISTNSKVWKPARGHPASLSLVQQSSIYPWPAALQLPSATSSPHLCSRMWLLRVLWVWDPSWSWMDPLGLCFHTGTTGHAESPFETKVCYQLSDMARLPNLCLTVSYVTLQCPPGGGSTVPRSSLNVHLFS